MICLEKKALYRPLLVKCLDISLDVDGLVEEDVRLPGPLDILGVVEEEIVAVVSEGMKGTGRGVWRELGEVPHGVVVGHPFQLLLLDPQTIILPEHPAS